MQTLTTLEDLLAADADGSCLREWQTALMAEDARLGYQLRQPQGKETYASLERQRRACLAALRVIQVVWQRSRHAG